ALQCHTGTSVSCDRGLPGTAVLFGEVEAGMGGAVGASTGNAALAAGRQAARLDSCGLGRRGSRRRADPEGDAGAPAGTRAAVVGHYAGRAGDGDTAGGK